METYINKKPENNEKHLKWLNHLATAWTLWFAFCVCSLLVTKIESNLLNKANAVIEFKGNCIKHAGKIRHEKSVFSTSIYCSENEGSETAFYFQEDTSPFMILLLDKVTFRFFELVSNGKPCHVTKVLVKGKNLLCLKKL